MVDLSFSEHAHIIITQPGENIWGRGSIDDKGGLIGILCAVFMSYSLYPQKFLMQHEMTIAPRLNPSSKPNFNRGEPSYSLLDSMKS